MKKTATERKNKLLKYLVTILGLCLIAYAMLLVYWHKYQSKKVSYSFAPLAIEKEIFNEIKVEESVAVPTPETKKSVCISLKGTWSLFQENTDRKINAALPGDVHSALINAGMIPDPYFKKNEILVQWVGDRDWVYQREFQVDPEMLDYDSIYLNLDSVDTFSRIFINGQIAGNTENMFRRYRFEIKPFLKVGTNTIAIKLFSPVKKARELALFQGYPVPYSTNNQIPYMNLIRKVQCHAGWDWGICLAVSGIYGDISINTVNLARLEQIYTEQIHDINGCKLKITTELMAQKDGETDFAISIDGQELRSIVKVKKGLNKVLSEILIKKPRLWWPVGYGDQPLYDLKVETSGQEINKKIGLRKLEIINEPTFEGQGKGLTFRINGVDVFCKGANWIPVDALPSRQTSKVYENLLDSAVEANMNMLRVWGGGKYEKDIFYQLCDEKGILVWQDLMFACSLYPADNNFITNVYQEVLYQTKRLRDHPSLVLWCGDNEVLGAINWYQVSRDNREFYLSAYKRLNDSLKKAVTEGDPTRVFWPSSPCGGPEDFTSDNWLNDQSGDMHFWQVWHGSQPFEAFYSVSPRFCSEFGFQSFPSLETVKRYIGANESNVTSPGMEFHQRNPGGNARIVTTFCRYFRMPKSFEDYLYLSQLQQALAIKTAVEFWRQLKPRCMGTLYWQLNDNWPVSSWSSIEYGGKWKQLQYQAKRFYAPVIGAVIQRKYNKMVGEQKWKTLEEVQIWSVSDLLMESTAKATVKMLNLNGETVKEWEKYVFIPPQGKAKILNFSIDAEHPQMQELFLTVELDVKSGNKTYQHSNTHFFLPFKNCELPDAKIKKVVVKAGKTWKILLETDKPAFFVTLDTEGIPGRFGDNSFTLLPGKGKIIEFRPDRENFTLKELQQAISLKHLRETY